jgi:hypothetical protein
VNVSASVDLGYPDQEPLTVSALARTVKTYTSGKIAPTDTTCEAYTARNADDLDTVLYGVKDGLINNAAPGVFYYYTYVTAPDNNSFTVDVAQSILPGFAPFEVQNELQIRLYDENCNLISKNYTSSIDNGQAHLEISKAKEGDLFVISVKYDTATVVGLEAPIEDIKYLFRTFVNDNVIDFDPTGLFLRSK